MLCYQRSVDEVYHYFNSFSIKNFTKKMNLSSKERHFYYEDLSSGEIWGHNAKLICFKSEKEGASKFSSYELKMISSILKTYDHVCLDDKSEFSGQITFEKIAEVLFKSLNQYVKVARVQIHDGKHQAGFSSSKGSYRILSLHQGWDTLHIYLYGAKDPRTELVCPLSLLFALKEKIFWDRSINEFSIKSQIQKFCQDFNLKSEFLFS